MRDKIGYNLFIEIEAYLRAGEKRKRMRIHIEGGEIGTPQINRAGHGN